MYVCYVKIISFGGKISLAEAQAMLDEYDMDGGGTIDFFEFMVLILLDRRNLFYI